MTHQEKMIKQEKQLKEGEILLAKMKAMVRVFQALKKGK